MNIITIEEEALYKLVELAVKRVTTQNGQSGKPDRWIDESEAMGLLKIKSKTTRQTLRDNGKIAYSQPMKKIILYDRDSIIKFIESNVKSTF